MYLLVPQVRTHVIRTAPLAFNCSFHPQQPSTAATTTAQTYSSHLQHSPTAPPAINYSTLNYSIRLQHSITAPSTTAFDYSIGLHHSPRPSILCGFGPFSAVIRRTSQTVVAIQRNVVLALSCALCGFMTVSAPAIGCGNLYSAPAKRSSQCNVM